MATVDELIGQLESGSVRERRQAAELLGQLGDPRAVPALLKALKKPRENTEDRTAAAHAIGKIGDLSAVPELINAYKVRKGFVDVPIITAVGEILRRTSPDDDRSREIFSHAVDYLIQIAQDNYATPYDVRVAAVDALGRSRAPQAIPALTKRILEDNSPDVQKAAVYALRNINDPQAIQALIQVATNKSILPNLRETALSSLGEIGNPEAVDTLIPIMEDSSEKYSVRAEAARALGRIGDPKAIEPLIRTLEKEREGHAIHLNEAIAEALGAFRDPRVIDPLVNALGRGYSASIAAAESLMKLRDRRTVEPLARILENDEFELSYPRKFAVRILGVLGDPRAVPALAKALRDDDDEIREAAFESIQPFIITHPDAILRVPPEDRHLLGRIIQEEQRDELLREVCN
jgi:HEAT repeat protein